MKEKIDPKLLNRLVREANEAITAYDKMTGETKEDTVVELSKIMGLMSGISFESSALVGDILKLVKSNAAPEVDLMGMIDLPGLKSAKN